jgi:hypothetical protein
MATSWQHIAKPFRLLPFGTPTQSGSWMGNRIRYIEERQEQHISQNAVSSVSAVFGIQPHRATILEIFDLGQQ